MGVYLWTNTYEYSYDFIGKTTSQIWNDGWATTYWTPSINSYWFASNSTCFIQYSIGSKLTNAKKIIFNLNWRHWNSWTADLGFSTTNWSSGTTYTNTTWVYNSYSNYNEYQRGGTKTNFSHTLASAWPIAYTYTLDLVNKTINLTYTTGSTSTFNRTLTDSQITNIKANNYIVLSIAWSNEAIWSINLTIEE